MKIVILLLACLALPYFTCAMDDRDLSPRGSGQYSESSKGRTSQSGGACPDTLALNIPAGGRVFVQVTNNLILKGTLEEGRCGTNRNGQAGHVILGASNGETSAVLEVHNQGPRSITDIEKEINAAQHTKCFVKTDDGNYDGHIVIEPVLDFMPMWPARIEFIKPDPSKVIKGLLAPAGPNIPAWVPNE